MSDLNEDGMTQSSEEAPLGGAKAYEAKAVQYFANARLDYVAELPDDPTASILEVGCGEGMTGALALSRGKCAFYAGIDIFEKAVATARGKISEAITGDIEAIELPWPQRSFDVLILSEVLEHLTDPWATLQKLRPLLKPGGLVFASSPNVSHYRVVAMLLRGEWNLADSGIMDRTHLRWFTPKTYRVLFESTGYRVDSVRELSPLTRKAQVVARLSFGHLKHLFISQIDLRAHRV